MAITIYIPSYNFGIKVDIQISIHFLNMIKHFIFWRTTHNCSVQFTINRTFTGDINLNMQAGMRWAVSRLHAY